MQCDDWASLMDSDQACLKDSLIANNWASQIQIETATQDEMKTQVQFYILKGLIQRNYSFAICFYTLLEHLKFMEKNQNRKIDL